MNLEKIVAISGKPGLFLLLTQTRTGFLAESMLDGKKITVSLKANVSMLSEISVYTYEGEKPLSEIMSGIAQKHNFEQAISHKESNEVLLAYLREIMPDYDETRVYASDVKKILNWYNSLQAKGMLKESEVKEESTTEKA